MVIVSRSKIVPLESLDMDCVSIILGLRIGAVTSAVLALILFLLCKRPRGEMVSLRINLLISYVYTFPFIVLIDWKPLETIFFFLKSSQTYRTITIHNMRSRTPSVSSCHTKLVRETSSSLPPADNVSQRNGLIEE